MANGKTPTNTEIYALINGVRLELKGDISTSFGNVSQQQGQLNKRFEELEAGRITQLETKLATINGKLAMFGLFVILLQIAINMYFKGQ